MTNNIKPSVKVILEKNNKILFLKSISKGKEYWILPGGKIEYGESSRQALNREIKEELNCSVTINDIIGMYHFFLGPNNNDSQIVATVFEGSIENQDIDITQNPANEGIKDYQWLTISELESKPNTTILSKFLKNNYIN